MNLYQQEKAERRMWGLAGIGTTLSTILILCLLLGSCGRKAKTGAVVVVTPIDSTRIRYELQVEGATKEVIIIRKNAQQTVTDYETALTQYDTTRITLP